MDYGQPTNNYSDQALFSGAITSGVGESPDSANPDLANSLNSGAYSPERNLRNVGNTAISSYEAFTEAPIDEQFEALKDPRIGHDVVDPGMPPTKTSSEHSTDMAPIPIIPNPHKAISAAEEAAASLRSGAIPPATLVNIVSDAREAYRGTLDVHAKGKGEE